MNFTRLDKNVLDIQNYLRKTENSFCDLTLGVKYLWRNDFLCDYCIYNDTLIIKESCPDYKDAFYFPIGKDVLGALNKIEEYCAKRGDALTFCCLDNQTARFLLERYPNSSVYNDRNWSDYIYDATAFKSFAGKKYNGQRNHVNKFKKLYPQCEFSIITKDNLDKVIEFASNISLGLEFSVWTKNAEAKNLADYCKQALNLNQVGGFVQDNGKIIGFSFGEIVGQTLYVHVEKAIKDYQGIYPFLANSFAKAFANDKVLYINREEDCGDMGLRISKLQYQPIEIKQKNILTVKTLFDKVANIDLLQTDRLSITPIFSKDKQDYFNLYTNEQINKYWGYDYKQDILGEPTPDDFYNFMLSLKSKKEEVSFAVRVKDKLIGELVVYNFDFFNSCEIGYRFFDEYQGKGYGFESANLLIQSLKKLGVKKFNTRCYKQNIPSYKLALKLGYKLSKEDQTHYYFTQQA